MSVLVLVRHSNPAARSDINVHDWVLTLKGIQNATILAGDLGTFLPFHLASSPELKAMQTAQVISEGLDLDGYSIATGAHEHRRNTMSWYDDDEERRAAIQRVFSEPDAVVLGEESARAAFQRFRAQVDALKAEHPDESLVVVTHGTVMALFAGFTNDLPPGNIWERLGLPSYIVLDLDTYRLQRIVARIE